MNRGAAFPARRDDFASDEAYNNWKKIELKQITENIAVMIALNPDLKIKESTEIQQTLLSAGPNDNASKRTSFSSNPRRTTFAGTMHPETMSDAIRLYEAARSAEQRSVNSQYSYNSQQPQPQYSHQPYPPYNTQQQQYPHYNPPYNPSYNPSYNPPYNPPYSHQIINEPKELNPPIEVCDYYNNCSNEFFINIHFFFETLIISFSQVAKENLLLSFHHILVIITSI